LDPKILKQKVADAGLRELVSSGSDEEVSVLVELGLAEPQVELSPPAADPSPEGLRAVKSVRREVDKATEERVRSVESLLRRILGTAPNWLASSHTFVIRIRAGLLREVAELPDVSRIIPNRRRG
jgi:hypothetical protein